MGIQWFAVLCPWFSLHFWEMAWVDVVVDLEVVTPSITKGVWCGWRWRRNLLYYNTRGDCNWGESACSFSWRSFIATKLVMAKGGRPWCWLCTLCVSPIGKVDTQSNRTSWRTSLKFSDCGVGGPYISWIGSAETLLGSLWEGPWDISSWIEDGDMVYNHHLCLKGGFVALVA